MSNQEIDLVIPPGGVIVVGPKGRMRIKTAGANSPLFEMVGCSIIGTDDMSDAQMAIIAEAWKMHGDQTMPEFLERAAQDRPKAEETPEMVDAFDGAPRALFFAICLLVSIGVAFF